MQESVIPKQQQYRLVLVDTWWNQVIMEWYWLVLGGTRSVEGGTGLYQTPATCELQLIVE